MNKNIMATLITVGIAAILGLFSLVAWISPMWTLIAFGLALTWVLARIAVNDID